MTAPPFYLTNTHIFYNYSKITHQKIMAQLNVLSEEKADDKRGYIKGKLAALGDIQKKLKKLDKE